MRLANTLLKDGQLGQLSLASLWGCLMEYQLRLGKGWKYHLCRVAGITV